MVPPYFLSSSPGRHFFCLYEFASLGHFIKTNGFPDSSVGKESACNAGDPSSIPGSGRSPGEGKVYPLQYSIFTSLHKNKVIVCGHLSLASSSSYCPPSTNPCPVRGLHQGQLGKQLSIAQTSSWKTFLVGINSRRTSGFSRKSSQDLAAERSRQFPGWDCRLARQDGVMLRFLALLKPKMLAQG